MRLIKGYAIEEFESSYLERGETVFIDYLGKKIFVNSELKPSLKKKMIKNSIIKILFTTNKWC